MKNPLPTLTAPALCFLVLCAGAGRAGTLPLVNSSFEFGDSFPGGISYDIPGWLDFGTDQTRRFVTFTTGNQAADGALMLVVSQGWQVWQDAGVQYQPHTIYLLEAETVNVSGKTVAGNISRIVLSDSGEANHTWSDLDASALPANSHSLLKHRWNTEADPLFNGRPMRVKLESPGAGPSHFDVVRLKSCGTFTGGDAGEGLDLQGTFVHAVNAGSGAGAGAIGDANFRADSHPAVLFLDAPGEIDPWAALDLGGTTNDNRLEHVMRGIRHGGALGSKMTVRLTGLHSGWPYKLQLLFVEQSDDRGFDVKVDGQMVADDFRLLDYGPFGTPLCLTHAFTATGDTADIVLDASSTIGIPHPNPLLSGLTVEQLEPWIMDANAAPPVEAKTYGHAGFQASGGTLNSGAVRLTDNIGSQEGALVVDSVSEDKAVNSFDVTFDFFCGQGGGSPADGYSFCWGTDLPAGTWGEEGTGNGLIVSFDTYVNPGETQREVVVKWKGAVLGSVPFDAHNDTWTAVHIRLRPGGYLDVRHGVNQLFSGLKLPDISPKIGPRWGWGARTGGLASRQWVDNVIINPFPLVVSQGLDTTGGLHDAISRTAARPGPDQIHFAPGLDGKTLLLTSGLWTSGQTLLIDASMLPHGFTISPGNVGGDALFFTTTPGDLTLDSLTVARGLTLGRSTICNGQGLRLSRCTLRDNTATITFGGAVHNSGIMEAEFCTFTGNSSPPGAAPALYNSPTGRAIFTNCTFSGNRAQSGGSACISNLGVMSLTHCTVAANLFNNSGGGILNEASGTMTLTNCVVAGNGDSDLSNAGTLTFEGANLVQKYTNTGTQTGLAPISADPRLMTPGDHGGPVWTMPPHADSPVIDAAAVSATPLDARGLPRGRDGNADGTAASDLGAVERGPRIVVTSPADSGAGSLRDAIAAATTPDTMISFAPAMSDAVITLTGPLYAAPWFTVDATALPKCIRVTMAYTPPPGPPGQSILSVGPASRAMFAGVQFFGGGSIVARGGAVENAGAVFFSRCTFYNNGGSQGGAVYSTGRATLSQCTVSGNAATGSGGGIYNAGVPRIHHCTISENRSSGQGGGVSNESPWSVVAGYSIVAGNTGTNNTPADVSNTGFLAWEGANIVRAVAGNTTGPAPNNADPLLAPLDFSLGPMGVQATKAGSPARGGANDSIVSDQRGYPIVGLPDLGAYEAGTYYTYAIWRTELLPEPGNGTDDADKDGTNNYSEYALNRNPNVRDQELLPFVSGVPGDINYTFRYQPAAREFTYYVQSSTNLVTWLSILRFDQETGSISNPIPSIAALHNSTARTIEVRNPINSGKKEFYRLIVVPHN